MCLFCFKCASRLALSLCYSPSQRAGGQGRSDLLSATISSTSSVGSSNSPTSTWTGLAPTGSCRRGWYFCCGCTAPAPEGQSSSPWLPRALEMLLPEQGVLRGWVRRRDRSTYLCGGIFNDLCLIRQSLLLQRKMHMRGVHGTVPRGVTHWNRK